MRRVRAVARLAHAVVHGLHGLAIVLFEFPSLDAAARQRADPLVVEEDARRPRHRLRAPRHAGRRRQPARRQPHLVARHHGDPRRRSPRALRLQGRCQGVAAGGAAGRLGRDALPRARTKARCAARRPCGRGGAERGPGGRDLPRGNDVDRPRPVALPRQPAAGGDRHGDAGAAGGAALLGSGQRGQRRGRVRRRDQPACAASGRRRAAKASGFASCSCRRVLRRTSTGASSPRCCVPTSPARSASIRTLRRRRAPRVAGCSPGSPPRPPPSPPPRRRRGSSCGSA